MPSRHSRSPSPRRERRHDSYDHDRDSSRRKSKDDRERDDYREGKRSSRRRESRDEDESPRRKRHGDHEDDDGRGGRRERRNRGGERDRNRDRDREEDRRRDRKDKDKDKDRRDARERVDRTPSDDEELLDLKMLGIDEITEEDYFLRSDEFRYWLKDARGKYLDELSSENAHRYFRRFVRRWNDGALREKYYRSHAAPSSSHTGYKWSFASNRSRVDPSILDNARRDVDQRTHSTHPADASRTASPYPHAHGFPSRRPNGGDGDGSESDDEPIGPVPEPPIGPSPLSRGTTRPSAPTASDRQLAKEVDAESRKADRKASAREAYGRAEEMAPKGVGKEGKMAERKATNEENKQWREKDVTAGLEADEGTLMGDNSSFAAALRARDAANSRREDRKAMLMADRRAADEERLMERKAKESSTMDMLKAMAKQRFG